MKIKHAALNAFIFSLSLGAIQTASAGSFFLSLNPAGAFTDDAAAYDDGFGPHSGISMPDGSSSSFAFGITLPLTYTSGDPIYIGVTWHTDAAAPCTAELRPNSISVARRNQTHIIGGSASTGLASLDGNNILDASGTNSSKLKVYVITPPDGATALKPLDAINFSLYRPANGGSDNCLGEVVIQGVAVAAL